jgi:hypothetical protein
MSLIESNDLDNKTSLFLIALDNKEYLVCSSWDGGITIVEVTK